MKNEAGFLLINILVVLAISAVIVVGAGMTTVQLIKVTQSTEDHAILARQPQNLGYWLSQDLMMAMVVTTEDDIGTPETEFAIIMWKDWELGDMYEVRYSWANPEESQKQVIRTKTHRDIEGAVVSEVSTLVADNINAATLTLPLTNPKTLTVEALSGERSASVQYDTSRRSE